jgi:hypothetical protein
VTTLSERLEKLDAAVEEARQRRSEASARRRWRARAGVGKEATADLREYCSAVRFSKREPDPEEHARLTREFFKTVEERGLLLDPSDQGQIRVLDPALEAEERDANEALVQAKKTRDDFLAEHRTELEAEAAVAESRRFREATEAGDVETVKEILATRATQPTSTLVTSDLG